MSRVLALLLFRRDQLVEVEALVDELWGDRPPRRAVSTVRTHIYHLRRFLEGAAGRAAGELLTTRPQGYLLRLGPDRVDAEVFTRLVESGRDLLAEGRYAEASRDSRTALEMWRGRPLENTAAGALLHGHVRRLEELRIQALEQRVEADMRLGRHRELVPELRDLVAAHPLNEWFHARLIEALRRSGRRADALRAFEELSAVLAAELGLRPTGELLDLHRRIRADALAPTGSA
ncbi:transcriptional regulator [Marinitenerispora sediminis]|uniref:Transcriptional regulator n=1 Tax=Marinitenerispora sediminis TaxID=1931232 RepID=A0A368T6H2_9ACTN|nr:transcriptional regulator [Marinitenerispora sediminis]RCV59248.1 transcriptional regulator [Marinitenerispora sediminis]